MTITQAIEAYRESGRVAFHLPRLKQVSLNGGPRISEKDAMKRISETLSDANYPFVNNMVFCSRHTKNSNVAHVCECPGCYAPKTLSQINGTNYISDQGGAVLASVWFDRRDPFATAEPCWQKVGR